MVAVKSPDIMLGSITVENILSIRVLECLVILVGCEIKGINDLEARESKNSFVLLCSLWFNRLTLLPDFKNQDEISYAKTIKFLIYVKAKQYPQR